MTSPIPPDGNSQPPKPNGEARWGRFMSNRLWLQTVVICLLILAVVAMYFGLFIGIATDKLSPEVAALAGILVGSVATVLGLAGKDYFNPED